jgi:2-isopropylmalate synthase
MERIRRTVEYCNQMRVPERTPWGGDLVFTAFSGSHQDAIKKGLDAMEAQAEAESKSLDEIVWEVPYLPIDPQDIGRSYEAVIRVNSQSGKGGVSYLLRHDRGLDLPRRAQIEFSGVVQKHTDNVGGEVTSDQLWQIFQDEYLPVESQGHRWGHFRLGRVTSETQDDGSVALQAQVFIDGTEHTRLGRGNGPIAAFLDLLSREGVDVRVLDYTEHAIGEGGEARAAAYVECAVGERVLWGAGIHTNTTVASLDAVVSAVNRAIRDQNA